MPENRYSKLLRLQGVQDTKRSKVVKGLPNNINALNANKAGLFTEQDIIELDNRIEKEERIRGMQENRPVKPFKRITIQNAAQEELRNAMHKVLIGD